jgi:hypothetical protein
MIMHKLLLSLILLSFSFLAVQAQDERKKADKFRNEYRQQALKQRLASRAILDKYRKVQTNELRKQRFQGDRSFRKQGNNVQRQLLINERLRQGRQMQAERLRLYRLYRKGKLS